MIPVPQLFHRSTEQRVVAGVCGGLGERLAVDPNLVRLVFSVLALAGGAGIFLYLALWVHADRRHDWLSAALVACAGAALLFTLGFSGPAVLGATLILAGLAVVLVRGGSIRQGGTLPVPGIALLLAGAVVFLSHSGATGSFVAPGAIAGALVLVVGPWLWRLTAERNERIRLQERAAVAARVHDSVLQTLALVQRHADDPGRIAALARRQERELRRWLYGSFSDASTVMGALDDAADDVERLHGVAIEIASAGDAPLDDRAGELVLAAREAMTNAAKFAGVSEIAVYAEAGPDALAIFVRDRGSGFDRDAVDPSRRGIAESIEGRMARVGGAATIVSAPGEGTEVVLRLPQKVAS